MKIEPEIEDISYPLFQVILSGEHTSVMLCEPFSSNTIQIKRWVLFCSRLVRQCNHRLYSKKDQWTFSHDQDHLLEIRCSTETTNGAEYRTSKLLNRGILPDAWNVVWAMRIDHAITFAKMDRTRWTKGAWNAFVSFSDASHGPDLERMLWFSSWFLLRVVSFLLDLCPHRSEFPPPIARSKPTARDRAQSNRRIGYLVHQSKSLTTRQCWDLLENECEHDWLLRIWCGSFERPAIRQLELSHSTCTSAVQHWNTVPRFDLIRMDYAKRFWERTDCRCLTRRLTAGREHRLNIFIHSLNIAVKTFPDGSTVVDTLVDQWRARWTYRSKLLNCLSRLLTRLMYRRWDGRFSGRIQMVISTYSQDLVRHLYKLIISMSTQCQHFFSFVHFRS